MSRDKSGYCKCSSRSASPGSETSDERLKLQSEVAQLRKTVERNEATAALELEFRSMNHELEIQKLVTEILFAYGARSLSDETTLQEIVCLCDNSSTGVGARQWLENTYSKGSAGAMISPSLAVLLADFRLKYQEGQDETAAVKGLMLLLVKERQASGADRVLMWKSKQRRVQQLQIPDLPIEY